MSMRSSPTSSRSYPNGWSRSKTGTWHYHAGGPYLTYSMCEQVRNPPELLPEPDGQILCPGCIKAMKRLVKKLEAMKSE